MSNYCKPSKVHRLKLTYFPIHGRGASIRFVLFIRKIPYDEDLINMLEFIKMKQSGDLEWSGLPMLTLYDKDDNNLDRIGQSNAILKYVTTMAQIGDNYVDNDNGKFYHLYPTKEPVICLRIDEILCALEDLGGNKVEYVGLSKDAIKIKLKKEWESKQSIFWSNFDKKLVKNGTKYGLKQCTHFVGNLMTIADIRIYFALLTRVNAKDTIAYYMIKKKDKRFENLLLFFQTMKSNPLIVEFENHWQPNWKQFPPKPKL